MEAISGDFSGTRLTTSAFVESGLVADPGLFVAGDFAGGVFLTTGALTCPIVIDGDMLGAIEVWSGGLDHGTNESGDITIYGGMYSDGYLWCGGSDGFIRTLVRIAGDFGNPTDAADITAKGLYEGSDVGQIIINADPPGSEWQGDVTIDGTLLSPVPDYANEDLIGAVGEVPFHLHDGDCIPENGDTFAFNDGLVVLRFYGPVTWDEIFPFNISWCPGGSSCDPVSENARWMVVSGQGTRTITLQYVDTSQNPAEIPSGRNYTIIPVLTGANKLLCDKLLTTSDVVVADFEYTFSTP